MEHFHKNIHGWFDFESLYSSVINDLPDNSHVVEIGAYLGKSTAYLAVEIINSKKNIKLDVVDTWDGNDGSDRGRWADYSEDLKVGLLTPTTDIFDKFKNNLSPVWYIINPVRSLSTNAADFYIDKSLDFVFIDANHIYQYIKTDIQKWLPKVKSGGFIGGHDYNPSWGVIQAVAESFKQEEIIVIGGSWLVHVK